MTLVPTWDLFIIILFVVIIAYSFIVGRDRTGKIVIASYIGLLTADGLGNLVYQHIFGPNPTLKIFMIQGNDSNIIILKIILFVTTIVLLTLKGGYETQVATTADGMTGLFVTTVTGFLSAALIVSGMLVYLSGGSFLPGVGFAVSDLGMSIYDQSYIARTLVDNSSLWFSLPALAFIISSYVNE